MLPKSVHLLLVEDDEVDVMTLKRALKQNHMVNPLHVASNGQEALDLLTGENGVTKLDPLPKIILLDINMPVMNGLEFLKLMRQIQELKPLHVFVLTTSDEERDKVDAYNLNVSGYVVKPVGFESFKEIIATLNLYWNLIELTP